MHRSLPFILIRVEPLRPSLQWELRTIRGSQAVEVTDMYVQVHISHLFRESMAIALL